MSMKKCFITSGPEDLQILAKNTSLASITGQVAGIMGFNHVYGNLLLRNIYTHLRDGDKEVMSMFIHW